LASEGRYREDLLARLNLRTFHLPGLVDRREDIEPNLVYKLRHYAKIEGREITSNKKALERRGKGLDRKLATNLTANVVGCSGGFDLTRKGTNYGIHKETRFGDATNSSSIHWDGCIRNNDRRFLWTVGRQRDYREQRA
jgi:hypothetical protein